MAWGAGDGGQGRANLGRWEMARDDELREQRSRHSDENAEDSREDAAGSTKHNTKRGSIYKLIGILIVAFLIGFCLYVYLWLVPH